MAASPFSSSGAPPRQNEGPAITQVPFYSDGVLKWDEGELKDEDIITATRANSTEIDAVAQYRIFSLAPTDASGTTPFKLVTTSAKTLPDQFLDKHLFQGLPTYLSSDSNVLHVLISTLSGTGLAPSFFDEVVEPLLGAIGLKGSDYDVVRTKSAESVKEFARSVLLVKANEGKKQTVLMLSGDGGMVDTMNGLLDSEERLSEYIKPTLAQLPLGTGNALFHSLHRPSHLPSLYIEGLRTLLRGIPRPLPIFRAVFSPGARLLTNEGQTATPLSHNALYGAVVASYGLHATLVADSDTTEYRKHGDKRFRLVANDLLFPEGGASPHAYKANVTLLKDGGKEDIGRKEHGYVLATLVSNLEKTFTVSPMSKPLDGQIRVVHFGAVSGEETMEIMKGAYNEGKHIGMKMVGYEEVEGLRIQFNEEGGEWKWRRCCVDGLIVGVEEGGWMEVRKVEVGKEAVDILVDA